MKNSSSSINISNTTGEGQSLTSSGFSLIHKKSDICEWTDSMADVSLTGIFTDLQSPVKHTSNLGSSVYNENSNNSIYISVSYFC